MDAPPNTGQRVDVHASDDRGMPHVATLNASTQQTFISTSAFSSQWTFHALSAAMLGGITSSCKATTYQLGTAKRYVARLMTATASGRSYGLASHRQRGQSQWQTTSLASANTFSPHLSHLPRCQGHRLPLDGASPVANADSLPPDAGARAQCLSE